MLPERFIEMLRGLRLGDAADAIAGGEPEVSVRVNPRKAPVSVENACGQVPWCREGWYLSERPSFTLDPQWHQGRYYVQEGASMFHSHVVRSVIGSDPCPITVLDACAAPGGKTTAVLDALPEGSVVVANEYVPSRAAVLRENIIKWGYPAVIVTRGDTGQFARMGEVFDLIIGDVPCSGEGMMRKDSEAVEQWSPGLVRECAARQWEIVTNLWDALRPGGLLVYSTCTFNREENELTVRRILDELGGESVPVPVVSEWGITPAILEDGTEDSGMHCYRFIPGRTRGEGLFVSVIRKSGEPSRMRAVVPERRSKVKGKAKGAPAVPAEASGWLSDPGAYAVYSEGERVSAFPSVHMPLLQLVRRHVDVIHEGVCLGTVKGRDLVPSQSLVMSHAMRRDAFPRVEVDRAAALGYLRGDSPVMPSGTPRGFVLLTYQGAPLGMVKNLGSRSNTLYPQPWRIRRM